MESEEEVSTTDSELSRHERASELLRDILLLSVPSSDTVMHHYILFLHPSIQLRVTVTYREYLGGTLRQ